MATSASSTASTTSTTGCPAQQPTGIEDCTQDGLTCDYGRTTCVCSRGPIPMANEYWSCNTPAPGCPDMPPTLGDPCTGTSSVRTCTYGVCPNQTYFTCEAGTWHHGFGGCPG